METGRTNRPSALVSGAVGANSSSAGNAQVSNGKRMSLCDICGGPVRADRLRKHKQNVHFGLKSQCLWYFTKDNRTKFGPVAFNRLKQLVSQAQIKRNDMVVPAFFPKWIPASSINSVKCHSDSLWFYSKDKRSKLGPVTTNRLIDLITNSDIRGSDLILHVNPNKWVPASSVPNLFAMKKIDSPQNRSKRKQSPTRHRWTRQPAAPVPRHQKFPVTPISR
jgi:hypothetical protein